MGGGVANHIQDLFDENGRYKNSFQSSGEINKNFNKTCSHVDTSDLFTPNANQSKAPRASRPLFFPWHTPAMTIVTMQALLRAGEVDKARARAESVLSTNKNHRDALLTLAKLASMDGDQARAEELLNRATKGGVEDTNSRLVRAALASEKGDLDGARALYTQVILESTQNPRAEAHFGLGFLLAAEEDFPGARKSLQRAVELEPKVAAYRFHLARILFALEELKLALPQLERALELNPLHPPTYVIWSVVLQQLGEMETAEDLLRQGLKLIPDHPELLNQLSAVLAARGKVPDKTLG
ncbi:tetratricopeptide repeat protein [Pyxidicoccus sp. MSG2]|uniref:tetratricopeptide repeat protein n=1 Tax=Pyxidicoccus sp. MSG2 TaxID=2996790 RepID=UPI00227107AA|nr:tetratricopeptide repeat protein [Pyxidicoccus sp. MSG2]MCY1019459.1 tetratricopeptide repeat protein [Pyxidicoccus sp. MSG2]